MEITTRLRERFCKDCNIPINIFHEPYFTDRINLYDKFYDTVDKWNIFVEELNKYSNEQDYFEHYNKVKDEAILTIKNSEAYQIFNDEDMNKCRIEHTNISSKDIFKPSNDGKMFISIDMRQANFSSLQYYGDTIFKSMFAGASTWEDFIGLFTDNEHIINSKYIRQVVLGNCNPKRHITYEKYLMYQVLDFITQGDGYSIEDIVSFSNDEIVIDMKSHECCLKLLKLRNILDRVLYREFDIPLKVELFKLHKINETNGYYKEIYYDINEKEIEFKCLDNYMLPFVIRYFNGEEVTESDKVFYHEGLLAKFIEMPKFEIN